VDEAERRLARALTGRLKLESAQVRGLTQRLESLNPLAILRRGYAVVTLADSGKVVITATQAPAGSDLRVRLAEGEVKARVTESG
jgi:exodeoxyribonuclease VII large subunit